jgi:hypothetical protein
MTIVDLSDLDTFIRDSLFEVRRGIANSRNATQANPLLGVMVDLPEKIDFEIMVTSAHQNLSKSTISSDSDKSSEVTTEAQKSITASTETGGSRGSTSSTSTSSNKDASVEVQTDSSAESGNEQGKGADGETTNSKTGTSESSSESESKQQQGGQTQGDKKKGFSKQIEIHAEANDRASKTFDEEEGTWGGQGQLSTPQLTQIPCTCT